ELVAVECGGVSSPVKTFLNGTMPALTNIRVGSLCGTKGADGTRAWPFLSKKSRKPRRTSLVEVMSRDVNALLHCGKARLGMGDIRRLGTADGQATRIHYSALQAPAEAVVFRPRCRLDRQAGRGVLPGL